MSCCVNLIPSLSKLETSFTLHCSLAAGNYKSKSASSHIEIFVGLAYNVYVVNVHLVLLALVLMTMSTRDSSMLSECSSSHEQVRHTDIS